MKQVCTSEYSLINGFSKAEKGNIFWLYYFRNRCAGWSLQGEFWDGWDEPQDQPQRNVQGGNFFKKNVLLFIITISFKVKAVNVKQKYLEEIGGIRVILSGTRITKFQKKNGTVMDIQV